jgi:uncharacterized membrane protein YeaQ/YmgE (transglycosylase-associated protein family)
MGIIGWLIIGLVAGGLARLLVPGRDDFSLLGTLVLGVVGGFIGGFLARVLFGDTSIGLIGSTIGAIIALLVYRSVAGGQRTAH